MTFLVRRHFNSLPCDKILHPSAAGMDRIATGRHWNEGKQGNVYRLFAAYTQRLIVAEGKTADCGLCGIYPKKIPAALHMGINRRFRHLRLADFVKEDYTGICWFSLQTFREEKVCVFLRSVLS